MTSITEYMKPQVKKNKPQVKKNKQESLTLMILRLYKLDFYQKQIARKLNVSKERVFYHTKRLLELGYLVKIARSNIVIYRVTKKGENAIRTRQVKKSLTRGETHPKITLHNLPIKIPIIKDSDIPDSEINEGLKNVPRQFKRLPFLGLTITRIQGKRPMIILNVHKREIDEPSEEFNVVLQSVILANNYLNSIGFELDIANITIEGREMSIPDHVAKKESHAKRYTKVGLGRTATKIMPNDRPKEAQAWIDASGGRPEIESNDRTWTENYLRLPDNIAGMHDSMKRLAEANEVYAENIRLHMRWVKDGIKVQNRLLSIMNQRKIKEFL